MSNPTENLDLSKVKITRATAKALLLDQTPGDEKFPFVVEKQSIFYRRTRRGIEPCIKRKGKGFPGGGVEEDETEKEAAIRECEEELGIPSKIIAERITDTTWIRYGGWEMHPWILFFGHGEGLQINRQEIKDEKLISVMGWNKAGWAHIHDLRKTIFAPRDPEERERRKEAGDVWFYTGHIVGLCAMLLLVERKDLFDIVLRQVSLYHIFARPMLEMLVEQKQDEVYLRRLQHPRFSPDLKLASRVIKTLVSLDREEHIDLVLAKADRKWKDTLVKLRDVQLLKKKTFGSLYLRAAEEEGRSQEIEEVEASPEEDDTTSTSNHPNPFLKTLLKEAKRQQF